MVDCCTDWDGDETAPGTPIFGADGTLERDAVDCNAEMAVIGDYPRLLSFLIRVIRIRLITTGSERT